MSTTRELEDRLKEAEDTNRQQEVEITQLRSRVGKLKEAALISISETKKVEKFFSDLLTKLASELKSLQPVKEQYYLLLNEHIKLRHELQDIKGNIRVYCRIRPLENEGKQTIIESFDEYGKLIVAGKEGRPRSFRFDKVYGPTSTQAQVFEEIQPFIKYALAGYSACIFAYGQTGSGKTYTMTGPDGASKEDRGINYRALDHLFKTAQESIVFQYEFSVQMVEIYDEQVRDLFSSHETCVSTTTTSQPVKSASDVVKLMDIGLKNRGKNERSSKTHSIMSIHMPGRHLKSGSSIEGGYLHLVDLAGSERAENISTFCEAIYALVTKSPSVPYRNSKFTQFLESSLGGHAKSVIFVQVNPDAASYRETLRDLTFGENASKVELNWIPPAERKKIKINTN